MDSSPEAAELGKVEVMDQAPSLDLRETSSASVVVVDDVDMASLEASIKKLVLSANDNSDDKAELSKLLEVARTQSADEKRLSRKAAWIAETQKEVEKLGQFRNSNVFHLLPELVWSQILEHLEDSKEKAMLSNMCLGWRDVLKMERTTFLFHEIFPKLNLSKTDLMTCRLVCREWKRSIEHHIQIPVDILSLSLLELYKYRDTRDRFLVDSLPLNFPVNFTRMFKFIEDTKGNHPADRNPIFSRRIHAGCFCSHDLMSSDLFWAQVERLLAQWGREVWTLGFTFSKPVTLNSAGLYKLICKLVKLTPNLRFLSFFALEHIRDTYMLKKSIEQQPMPELLHLNTISSNCTPPTLWKHMLNKYGPSLKQVFASGVFCNEIVFGGTRLPKMKNFSIMSFGDPSENFKFQVDWHSIEEMDLHYKNFIPARIPALFQAINEFGGTLRILNLKLEQVRGHGEPIRLDAAATKKLFLELPNLEYFSLAMALVRANLKTIDFILPMVSLKELTLYYVKSFKSTKCRPTCKECNTPTGEKRKAEARPSDSTETKTLSAENESSGEIIKFWKYAGRLYESNIWRLLPELKKVTIINVKKLEYPDETEKDNDRNNEPGNIKEKVYTREGYQQYIIQRE